MSPFLGLVFDGIVHTKSRAAALATRDRNVAGSVSVLGDSRVDSTYPMVLGRWYGKGLWSSTPNSLLRLVPSPALGVPIHFSGFGIRCAGRVLSAHFSDVLPAAHLLCFGH